MEIRKDDIFEAGRKAEKALEGKGFLVIFEDDGISIRKEGKDPIFGASVSASIDEYDGREYAAVGVSGESSRENGFRSAVASILPNTRLDLAQFLRFAVAAVFNEDMGVSFDLDE